MEPHDPKDPHYQQLRKLFLEELKRHSDTLNQTNVSIEDARKALHSVKGSAGLAGEVPLATALSRLERQLRNGDPTVLIRARNLVHSAIAAVEKGLPALRSEWPSPPPDLEPTSITEHVRTTYKSEMRDRLARIDRELTSRHEVGEILANVRRDIHAMKGAAAAANDEVTVWFCHGLEEHVEQSVDVERTLSEIANYRTILASLVVDPARALQRLRGGAGHHPSSSQIPIAPRVPFGQEAPTNHGNDDGMIRIASTALDQLVERLANLSTNSMQLSVRSLAQRTAIGQLHEIRNQLHHALRLIGPPKPWGAPAFALRQIDQAAATATKISNELEASFGNSRVILEQLVSETRGTSEAVQTMGRTPLSWLFERVRHAVYLQSFHMQQEVTVQTKGDELAIDRRVLEQLYDPILQIVRNSLAHGFENPEVRQQANKPAVGTLQLSASLDGNRLTIQIVDDGAGVNLEQVRQRASERNLLPPALLEMTDTSSLLDLLFLPGFSTEQRPDLLAGRGIGLDLALTAVRRLGGTVRIASEPGNGFQSTLEINVGSSVLRVLCVHVGPSVFALPAHHIERVFVPVPEQPLLPLGKVLSLPFSSAPSLGLEIQIQAPTVTKYTLGVDHIGKLEDVTLRPVSSVVRTAGPYLGAVVRPQQQLQLVLDPVVLMDYAKQYF
jgi:two-component system, chemotaxis family, sensor kinase CheA